MNDPSYINTIVENTQEFIPQATFESNHSGSLVFRVPQTAENNEKIPAYLKYLEDASTKSMIREWGISHPTLEDVFLKITKQHGFAYEDEEVQEIQQVRDGAVSHDNRKYNLQGRKRFDLTRFVR